jgi:hypothetical protein
VLIPVVTSESVVVHQVLVCDSVPVTAVLGFMVELVSGETDEGKTIVEPETVLTEIS